MKIKQFISIIFLVILIGICFVRTGEAATFYGDSKVGLQTITSDRYGAYFFVPATYQPDQDWPLVVVIYSDEAMKGPAFVEQWLQEIKKRNVLALFVSYLSPREAPFSSDQRFLSLLREMGLKYRIDERRIFLTAFGEAAHYAFYLSARYPHQFSAVALEGGGAQGRFELFLRHPEKEAKEIPFLILYGDKDKTFAKDEFVAAHEAFHRQGYQIELEEYENLGHQPHPELHQRMMDWFAARPVESPETKESGNFLFRFQTTVFNFLRGILKG